MATIKIFDKPEIVNLFWELMKSLLQESGRGALLVATAHVDDQLNKLIEAVLPAKSSKTFKKSLLNNHGPLSTLSGKIEICYAFRLIDKKLYTCLHALRKIRNEAAHSATHIELVALNERLKTVYDLGPGLSTHIYNMAINAMLKTKIEHVKGILDPWEVEDTEKAEFILSLLDKNEEKLLKQIPHWELVYGLTLLFGFMAYHRDNLINVVKNINVWGDLYKEQPGSDESI